ncbi:MAG TPA: nucleotidyltransferase family protein [Gemmatimonadaceae bacterium]|nr:nucleotidyltransferase family protein [Gemmatimonadaceae bacterium]
MLAAGASRRMGGSTNKLLLEIEGEPMVRGAVRRAVAAGLDPVMVVTGCEAERVEGALVGLPCSFVRSPDPMGPMSASLHAGLRALDDAVLAAVIVLGDMVHVTPAMMGVLAAAVRRGEARLAVSRYGPELALAPPVGFGRELWPELLACTGDGCGRTVAAAHLDEAVTFDWPATALHDVDTRADYDALR